MRTLKEKMLPALRSFKNGFTDLDYTVNYLLDIYRIEHQSSMFPLNMSNVFLGAVGGSITTLIFLKLIGAF